MKRETIARLTAVIYLILGVIDVTWVVLSFSGAPDELARAGWRTVAHDPGKTIMHCMVLPLAAYLLIKDAPTHLVKESGKRVLLIGVAASLFVVGTFLAVEDGAKGFEQRIPMPSQVKDVVLRWDLQAAMDSARKIANEADFEVKEDRERVEKARSGYRDLLDKRLPDRTLGEDASGRAYWAAFLSWAGILLAATLIWSIVALGLARKRPSDREHSMLSTLIALWGVWIPMRAYSEWYGNLYQWDAKTYTPMLVSIIAIVVCSVLLWFARKERSGLTVLTMVNGLLVVTAAIGKWQPKILTAIGGFFAALDGTALAATYLLAFLLFFTLWSWLAKEEDSVS
jgi:uncharacterized membrane protein YidH (DUF202 family)